jgi:hypothetical protein
MGNKIKLYRFSAGAKEDLLALHNEYTYSNIVAGIRNGIDCGGDFSVKNIKHNNLIIKLKGTQVIGITFDHLEKYARYYTFKCIVCFDAKKIQVGDPCSFCDGSGCTDCTDGLSFKLIACPNCTGKQEHGERDEWHDRIKLEREQSHGNRWTLPRQAARTKRRKAG